MNSNNISTITLPQPTSLSPSPVLALVSCVTQEQVRNVARHEEVCSLVLLGNAISAVAAAVVTDVTPPLRTEPFGS